MEAATAPSEAEHVDRTLRSLAEIEDIVSSVDYLYLRY